MSKKLWQSKMNRFSVNIAVLILCVAFYASTVYGASCDTPNGETGNCISVYECKHLLNLVQNKRRTPAELKFLQDSQCGFSGVPLVCCGTESKPGTFVTTSTTTISSRLDPESEEFEESEESENFAPGWENPLIPGRSGCGFQEADKIWGGENTDLDEFPWMALLQYQVNTRGWLKTACGGSLINPRYVLTAGHCVVGDITKIGPLVNVRLGDWNVKTAVDCTTNDRGEQRCNSIPPLNVGVDKVIAHENYNPYDKNKYNDIGLVRLDRNVAYSNYVRPICLPQPSEKAAVGDQLWVSGWGKTEDGKTSSIKQKVKVPVVNNTYCRPVFSRHGVTLDNTQLCAGGEKGKDSCAGDSGGPLMNTVSKASDQWYLEGLVSFGLDCGTKDAPGVYTRIASNLKWIHSNVER